MDCSVKLQAYKDNTFHCKSALCLQNEIRVNDLHRLYFYGKLVSYMHIVHETAYLEV
jgi:hypothetical protein